MLQELPMRRAGLRWMFGRQLQQVMHVTRLHITRLTFHVTRLKPADAEGDAQAAAQGGGGAAVPVHRKTRI